jgi:hypothetical protein
MSHIISTCAECGRNFADYDAAPRLWCSVWCETQPARDAETEARGAAAERAAVVVWLRQQGGRGAWTVVDAIERGEHRLKEKA